MNIPHEESEQDAHRVKENLEGSWDWGDREDTITATIQEEKVEAAIRRAENGKAMGQDLIPNEFFKQGGNSMLTSLTFLFNTILTSEYTPGKWREYYTRLLHKVGIRRIIIIMHN